MTIIMVWYDYVGLCIWVASFILFVYLAYIFFLSKKTESTLAPVSDLGQAPAGKTAVNATFNFKESRLEFDSPYDVLLEIIDLNGKKIFTRGRKIEIMIEGKSTSVIVANPEGSYMNEAVDQTNHDSENMEDLITGGVDEELLTALRDTTLKMAAGTMVGDDIGNV